MGVSAGLYMYDVVVKKFTFAISSRDEFLLYCIVELSPKVCGHNYLRMRKITSALNETVNLLPRSFSAPRFSSFKF